MVYTVDGFKLHKRDVVLKGGRKQTIYFFAKRVPKSGSPCDLPDNYKLGGKNKKTGLPYLAKK